MHFGVADCDMAQRTDSRTVLEKQAKQGESPVDEIQPKPSRIHLLAVILILGIIALIAIPTVNNVIKQSKKGAFEATVHNVVNAVENQCELDQLNDIDHNETYTFTDSKVSPSLNIKGKLPKSGTVTTDTNCTTTVDLTDGTFTATKSASSDTIVVS